MKLCALQIPFAYNEADCDASVRFAIEQLKQCDESCDIILTPEYTNAPANFEKGACIPYTKKFTEELLTTAKETARRCNAIVAVNYVSEADVIVAHGGKNARIVEILAGYVQDELGKREA